MTTGFIDQPLPAKPLAVMLLPALLALGLVGCNSIKNGWLDPTVLGEFKQTATLEIRSSLTLEDSVPGIAGATYPAPEDHHVHLVDYPIAAGDTLGIEINELRQRQIPFQSQSVVSSIGNVNLPIIGRTQAVGLTVSEYEDLLVETLRVRDVLRDPEVTVNPIFLQNATYSIFGIGVSAADNAPLRAGTFPIRRPDLRLLEAINQVGGLNEFVTDIYVFRSEHPTWIRNKPGTHELPEHSPEAQPEPEPPGPDQGANENHDGLPRLLPNDDVSSDERTPGEPAAGTASDGHSLPNPPVGDAHAPEAIDPYIWVDGEFVSNPAYRGGMGRERSTPPVPFETITPAVNWARIAGDTAYRVIRIPAEHLRNGNPEVDIVIRAGDVLRIVSGEIGVYYVMGQVNRVGPFAFNAESITLKTAIAAAGGLSGLAWPDRCTIYRRLGQREQMIQVNLDRIFAGKDQDFLIRRGDIINVGTHPFAPFLARIRALTLPNPVANVGYSFTYARNFADVDSFAVQPNPSVNDNRFERLFDTAVDREFQNRIFPRLIDDFTP